LQICRGKELAELEGLARAKLKNQGITLNLVASAIFTAFLLFLSALELPELAMNPFFCDLPDLAAALSPVTMLSTFAGSLPARTY